MKLQMSMSVAPYRAYLDDLRKTPDDFNVHWKTYKDATDWLLLNGCPVFISFDHDLGEEKTGYDLAKWLVDMDTATGTFIPYDFDFIVHSANPVGANNIVNYLTGYLEFRKSEILRNNIGILGQ